MADKVFQDIFKLEIEKMIKEANYIEPLAHKGVKGTIRELGLGNLLSKFLPSYLEVGNGQIHNSIGIQSHETDLIIYNKDKLPAILFDNSLGIFPIESLVYSMEIKTTSTSTEVKTSITKFKSLMKVCEYNKITIQHVYFAYASNLTKKSELERYFELDNKLEPSITVICVVGDGYYFYTKGQIQIKNTLYTLIEWVGVKAEQNYEVLCFIGGILNTVREYNIGNYILDNRELNVFYLAILDKDGNIILEKEDFQGNVEKDLSKIINESTLF